jgi:hypothetical protein
LRFFQDNSVSFYPRSRIKRHYLLLSGRLKKDIISAMVYEAAQRKERYIIQAWMRLGSLLWVRVNSAPRLAVI